MCVECWQGKNQAGTYEADIEEKGESESEKERERERERERKREREGVAGAGVEPSVRQAEAKGKEGFAGVVSAHRTEHVVRIKKKIEVNLI